MREGKPANPKRIPPLNREETGLRGYTTGNWILYRCKVHEIHVGQDVLIGTTTDNGEEMYEARILDVFSHQGPFS